MNPSDPNSPKPREYFGIHLPNKQFLMLLDGPHEFEPTLHLIEKSAYDRLQAEVDRLTYEHAKERSRRQEAEGEVERFRKTLALVSVAHVYSDPHETARLVRQAQDDEREAIIKDLAAQLAEALSKLEQGHV